MDLTPDPLFVQVRAALRTALAAVPVRPGVHGAPVVDGRDGPTRTVLDALGVADFERSALAGGLDLGLTAGVLVSAELGRAACGNSYRGDAVAADVGCPAGVALAGLEALPAGGGVTATPGPAGWALTGTATIDDPEAALLLVAVAAGFGGPVLVAVPRDAAGVSVQTGCWPPAVRFAATPVTLADLVGELDRTPADPLARARVRQAGYLLGIAEGAHRIALEHTAVRRQFDTRLRDLPAVSFPLARAEVALRATRAAVYRAAWLIDYEADAVGVEPVAALALAAETAREVVRRSMQSCGVRAMTAELGLHRYFRLVAAESARYGAPADLWRMVGVDCVRATRRAVAATALPTPATSGA
ncbi:acyl-CoA dehydrogenase family protein [Micromonospora sp. WMMD882]|uniref:acyl-CoA dehydrogenase family protein n=1 Tax=Micromonospora sp. WMMD882 TaxID=3015151 RepID=UPI00248BB301|nr:acyl-CoA dehydrogenase family protein [Micromonospora sp. WMMD882]WBB77718.1 acyl-CoA dehydrogenase family protein [Micromonospora sp. WMMD882]